MAEAKEINDLKSWTVNYLKNKDLLARRMLNIHDLPESLEVEYKDKTQKVFFKTDFKISIFDELNENEANLLVCKASRQNLNFLINNWNKLSLFNDLIILFVDVSNHSKWLINPRVHSKICDEDSLEMGLKSMFDNEFNKLG